MKGYLGKIMGWLFIIVTFPFVLLFVIMWGVWFGAGLVMGQIRKMWKSGVGWQ